jgi:hypothetical protein
MTDNYPTTIDALTIDLDTAAGNAFAIIGAVSRRMQEVASHRESGSGDANRGPALGEPLMLAGLHVSKQVAGSKHCISHQQNSEPGAGKRNFNMGIVNDDRDQREDHGHNESDCFRCRQIEHLPPFQPSQWA